MEIFTGSLYNVETCRSCKSVTGGYVQPEIWICTFYYKNTPQVKYSCVKITGRILANLLRKYRTKKLQARQIGVVRKARKLIRGT